MGGQKEIESKMIKTERKIKEKWKKEDEEESKRNRIRKLLSLVKDKWRKWTAKEKLKVK